MEFDGEANPGARNPSPLNVLKVLDHPPKEWQKYDLCLELPIEKESYKIRGESILIIRRLAKLLGRKYIYVYYSADGSRVYVLVRAGLKFLRTKAFTEKWQLQLDEEKSKNAAYAGSVGDLIDSFSVSHMPEVTSLGPFDNLYADFNPHEEIEPLYKRSIHMRHPFHKALRLKMLFDFFKKNHKTHQELALDKLKQQGTITDVFAIHYLRERDDLAEAWIPWYPAKLPIEPIQHYYGEELAMYFSFLEHLFNWLSLPALVGAVFEAVAVYYNDFSRYEITAFTYFMLFWMTTCLASWRKKYQMLALKWNTRDYNEQQALKDHSRYQFYGNKITSYIDGKTMLYFSFHSRLGFYILSFTILLLCILGSLASEGAILYYVRFLLNKQHSLIVPWQPWIVSAGIAVCILIWERVYFTISYWCTELENHRYEREFVVSWSLKLICFCFVNTLASCYYFAFGASYESPRGESIREQPQNSYSDCGFVTCHYSLLINVLVISCVKVLVKGCIQYLLPYVFYSIGYTCCGYYHEQYEKETMEPMITTASGRDWQQQDGDEGGEGEGYGGHEGEVGVDDIEEGGNRRASRRLSRGGAGRGRPTSIGRGARQQQPQQRRAQGPRRRRSAPDDGSYPGDGERGGEGGYDDDYDEGNDGNGYDQQGGVGGGDGHDFAYDHDDLLPPYDYQGTNGQQQQQLNSSTFEMVRPTSPGEPSPIREPNKGRRLSAEYFRYNAVGNNNNQRRPSAAQPQQQQVPLTENEKKLKQNQLMLMRNHRQASGTGGLGGNGGGGGGSSGEEGTALNDEEEEEEDDEQHSYARRQLEGEAGEDEEEKDRKLDDETASSFHSPALHRSPSRAATPTPAKQLMRVGGGGGGGSSSSPSPRPGSVRLTPKTANNNSRNNASFKRTPSSSSNNLSPKRRGGGSGTPGGKSSSPGSRINLMLTRQETLFHYGDDVTGGAAEQEGEGDGQEEEEEDTEHINPFQSYPASYQTMPQMVQAYLDIFMLFSLAVAFGEALPAIYLLFLAYCWWEGRGHAWLLLYYYPRPLPRACQDIAPWLTCFDAMIMLGILTSATIVTLTMTAFHTWSLDHKLCLWIGIVFSLFGYQYVMNLYYGQVPREVLIQKQRSLFVESKLVKRLPDHEDTLPLDML